MTIKQRQQIDRRLSAASKAAKFIRRYINKNIGRWIQNAIYDVWDNTY